MMHVLLIDPDPTALAVLGPVFYQDPRGLAVSSCPDHTRGWHMFRTQRPEAVFIGIDPSRPESSDSLSLANRIRRENDRTSIIFLSSRKTLDIDLFQAYPLDCLVKPIRKDRLRQTIDRLFTIATPSGPACGLTSPPRPSIRCFGDYTFQVEGPLKSDMRLPGRKCRELLAFLLSRPNQPASRDTLLEHLFDGKNDRKTINRLHTAVSALRKALKPLSGLVLTGQYSLLVEEGVCDLTDFLRLSHRITSIDEDSIREAERVAALFSGPCFESEEYVWMEPIRASLESAQERLLLQIAAYYETRHDWDRTERTLKTLIKLNPWSEGGQTALLDLYIDQNKPRLFIKTYEKFRHILEQELDLPMDLRFQKVYQTIMPS